MTQNSAGTSRVGIVDDHEQIIRGVQATLDDQSDLEFAGGSTTVQELLSTSDQYDLVLLDLRLRDDSTPRSNIIQLTDRGIPVLVYTSGDEIYLVRQAASAGVLGVLRKNAGEAEFLQAIRAALRGNAIPSVDWAAAIDSDIEFVDLSPQQRRVLQLYAAGESQIRVAHALHISTDTVTEYVNRIRSRYQASGRPAPTKSDLYKRAIEDGWLPIPRHRST